MTTFPQAADFPPATREAWEAAVARALKGADPGRLASATVEGLRIEPLYPKAEGSAPVLRGAPGPWRVVQRLDHPDPDAAASLALADLEGGADALVLAFAGGRSSRGYGLCVETLDDLDRALAGVRLDLIHLRLDPAPAGRIHAAMLAALARRRGHDPGALDIGFGLDPVGTLAHLGSFGAGEAEIARRLAETVTALSGQGFCGPFLLADARPVHEAGGGEAQELAFALAHGVQALRGLEAGGIPLEEARRALAFLLVADADEFLSVAKLRAMRRLWARVEAACGLAPAPIRLHAETAWRMTTKRDPHANLLRASLAAFSAGVGGADSVTILPFTAALGLPDALARRIARNTGLLLVEEAHLAKVADPAAGSGGFEALTDALCEAAWALFQEIEREGGLVASLVSGALQARIAATRAEREHQVARRRTPITGTSEFPNLAEAPAPVLDVAPLERERHSPKPRAGAAETAPKLDFSGMVDAFAHGASRRDLAPAPRETIRAEPLPSTRLAEPFEALREASDAALARTGVRPRIFLANLGPVAAFTPRATFAKSLFEAGGIEALSSDGFASPGALAEAFRTSGARLACLCSSDEVYRAEGEAAARGLREAGAARVYLAGRPVELEAPLRAAGVRDFVFAGCDALSVLREATREMA